jgi:spoIIIJ-associated protein
VDDDKQKRLLDGALLVGDEGDGDDAPAGAPGGKPGDGKAELATEVLDTLLAHMDLDTEVLVREDGPERVVLDVSGPDAGRAIGKKGATLEALKFLVNKIVNRFPESRRHIVVDSGDYRERYDNSLVSMAVREAKRAVTQGQVITLEPMSARDRRVIHLSLAKFEGVTTKSDGEGMGRRIQIIPSRGSRGGGDRDRDRDRPRRA